MSIDELVEEYQSSAVNQRTQEGIVLTDSNGTILYANKSLRQMFASKLPNPIGSNIFVDSGLEVPEQKLPLLNEAVSAGKEITSRRVMATDDSGNERYYNIKIVPLNGEGAHIGFVDVTREVLEAIYDKLTGAYTKNHFLRDLFPREKRRAERENAYLGMTVVDLKKFKDVNDMYGHTVGDDVLRTVAKIIRSSIRSSSDFLVRYGGDEFYILSTHLPEDLTGANRVGELLMDRMRNNMRDHNLMATDGMPKIEINLGFVADNKNYGEILINADRKMYEDKRRVPTLPNPLG